MEIRFWKDKSKKQLDPELFSSKAESLAQKIAEEGDSKRNNPTQIRKFFDEISRFNSMLKASSASPSEFENILPYLKMLNAKAAYSVGRDLISKGFKDFIANSLSQINDKDDFYAFAGLFEAFMGYYKFYRSPKGGGR